MKILYLVSGIGPPSASGSEYIQNMIFQVSRNGLDCTILSPVYLHLDNDILNWVKTQENKYKIRIITISSNRFIASNYLLHLAFTPLIMTYHTIRLLLKERFDLVHEFTSSPLILIRTYIIKLFFKIPSIISICAYNNTILGNIYWIKFLNCARKYLIPSKSMYKKLLSYGISTKGCEYFPPGVEVGKFQNEIDKEKARRILNLPKDKYIFLFFGPLIYEKGVDDILSAISILKSDDKKKMLFLFSTQPSIRFHKKKLVPETKFKNFNQILLKKGLTNINLLLSASDCVILPQRTGHGTTIPPISVIETLVKEKPLIITKTIGNEDLSAYKNVFFVKPSSPVDLSKKIFYIYKQLDNKNKDKTKKEENIINFNLFDLTLQSKLLLKIYEDVLADIKPKKDQFTV